MCSRARELRTLGVCQALVRAIAAAGIPRVILRSHGELAIPKLKRQAAPECRVKRGMTVIAEDSTE